MIFLQFQIFSLVKPYLFFSYFITIKIFSSLKTHDFSAFSFEKSFVI